MEKITILNESKEVKKIKDVNFTGNEGYQIRIYPYGVSRTQLEKLIKNYNLQAIVTKSLDDADMIFILKSYYKANNKIVKNASDKTNTCICS
ncbi:MAG: hypothetical protein KatS3mg068_0791 [Candidatus Sericytochromatia bacterium]|nr:MAG: hypothetical protein KatS3mg068_0791 [Candidatus Sericytochromatia bacterium]